MARLPFNIQDTGYDDRETCFAVGLQEPVSDLNLKENGEPDAFGALCI
jgi:hypothetical protein